MIAKHSAEQSQKGEGVEVVENRPHSDPVRLINDYDALDFFHLAYMHCHMEDLVNILLLATKCRAATSIGNTDFLSVTNFFA